MPSKRQRQTKKIDNDSILDQIERVVRWGDEFRLAFVKSNHLAQRETLRHSLLDRLHDQRVLEISLEKPIVSLLDEIRPLWNLKQPPVAVCVYGLEHSLREQGQNSPVLGRLNHERELLRQSISAALLIWLSDFALDYVARGAPDFWAWRSGVYEFRTDSVLWQTETITAFVDHDAVSLGSLSWEDKHKEISRLEESLRTSQALARQDKQVKKTNCRLLYQLGFLYASLNKQGEALNHYQKVLKLARALGDRAREAATLNDIALIDYACQDYERACQHWKEALTIQERIRDQAEEARTLNNIATIPYVRGEYAKAQKYLEKALAIYRNIRNTKYQIGQGTTLNNLSQVYRARGDDESALRYLKDALTIQQAIGDQAGKSTTLNNLSAIYQARGDYDTARRYLEESLAIQRAISDQAGEGTTLRNFSQLYQARGDYDTARCYLEESLAIQRAIGDQAGLCPTLFNMGHIYWQKDEHQQALVYWIEAYQIAKENGLSEALINLEKLAKKLGGNGLEYWEQQLARSTTNTQPQTKQRQVG